MWGRLSSVVTAPDCNCGCPAYGTRSGPRLPGAASAVWGGMCSGGAEGIRTPDLLNAIQTRSQLRHSPRHSQQMSERKFTATRAGVSTSADVKKKAGSPDGSRPVSSELEESYSAAASAPASAPLSAAAASSAAAAAAFSAARLSLAARATSRSSCWRPTSVFRRAALPRRSRR